MRKAIFKWTATATVVLLGAGCSPGDKTGTGTDPAGSSDSPKPTKEGVIDLINQSGLDGFVHHFKEESPAQEREDAWRILDGMLHITGYGWGYLRSRESYENYRLVVEYKWGDYTADIREDRARDSGIFVHADSKDGAFRNAWVSSFEAQMIEGRAGDIIVIAALDPETGEKAPHQLNSRAREVKVPGAASDFEHDPDAEPFRLPPPRFQRARIFRHPRDKEWKDEKGYLGPDPIEKPAGDWNRMVIVCDGDMIKITLNDQTVNLARNVTPARGHICIQSELSECWIRKLRLTPITEKADEANDPED